MLKRFYEKDKIGIICGQLGAVKGEKACLVEASIRNVYEPDREIYWIKHLWLDTRDVDQHYDYENNIVMFEFKAYKYLRANGSEDYSVMSI